MSVFTNFNFQVELVWDPLSILYPNAKVELGEFQSERKYIQSECTFLGMGCINGGLLLERQIGFYVIYAFIPSDRDPWTEAH